MHGTMSRSGPSLRERECALYNQDYAWLMSLRKSLGHELVRNEAQDTQRAQGCRSCYQSLQLPPLPWVGTHGILTFCE